MDVVVLKVSNSSASTMTITLADPTPQDYMKVTAQPQLMLQRSIGTRAPFRPSGAYLWIVKERSLRKHPLVAETTPPRASFIFSNPTPTV